MLVGVLARAGLATDNLDLGIPGAADQIVDREGYALGYCEKWEVPRWVVYRLTRDEAASSRTGRINSFRPDPAIRTGSAQLEDYRGSGYDRGHMAPAGDMKWSTDAMLDSFYLSNMCPQDRQNNSGIWNEIEQTVRGFATSEDSIYVVTGPIFDSDEPKKTIGTNAVAVPDGFYKVVYDETPPEKMIAFKVRNEPLPGKPKDYICTVDEIERATGLVFFPRLPDEKRALKSALVPEAWTWRKTFSFPPRRKK